MGVTYINPYRFAGFDPLNLSPALWLDASDTSTITASSGAVSQWNDKSGNGRNFTQASGANQPSTGTRSINNLNVIDFDGSNDVMGAGDVLDLGTNSITIVSVVQFDTIPSSASVLPARTLIGKYKVSPLAGSWLQIVEFSTTAEFKSIYRDGTAGRVATESSFSDTTSLLWITTVDRSAGTISQTRDGVSAGSSSFTPDSATSRNNATGVWMGALRNSADTGFFAGYWFNGAVAEIIVCLSVLTAQQITDVSTYLNSKWAL